MAAYNQLFSLSLVHNDHMPPRQSIVGKLELEHGPLLVRQLKFDLMQLVIKQILSSNGIEPIQWQNAAFGCCVVTYIWLCSNTIQTWP